MPKTTRTVHLVSNAHLDPVWLWEWEEGAAEALATFRAAADLGEQFDDYIFCHNEAVLYQWIEQYDPALFKRIQRLVRRKRWHILGGWYLQPDCNMPAGEGFVRQLLVGRRYFREKFHVRPTTAVNFDSFGHTRGLVQILAKGGYDSYLFCRPQVATGKLPGHEFVWVGHDGSEVCAVQAASHYNTPLGLARARVEYWLSEFADQPLSIVCWGVGNHGGGASRKDLRDLAALQRARRNEINLIHSTPDRYFKELAQRHARLPRHEGDLNPFAIGCYTSMARIKQRYRQLENEFLAAEKMSTTAAAQGLMPYPKEQLDQVLLDLLTAQFHDILPGSCIEPVEAGALRQMDHGLEILARVRARAFFALAAGQPKAREQANEVAILVYNPHPFAMPYTVECEVEQPVVYVAEAHQTNLSAAVFPPDAPTVPKVRCGKQSIACQAEQRHSSISGEWRKRVVFHTVLKPSSMNRFDCGFEQVKTPPRPMLKARNGAICFTNDRIEVTINAKTGLIDRYQVDGQDLLGPQACRPLVIQDDADAWGHTTDSYRNPAGSFTLMTTEESTAFGNLDQLLPSVRVIEDGPVRSVVEVLLAYNRSVICQRYKLPKAGTELELDLRVYWNEPDRMLKLAFPAPDAASECLGQVAYGVDPLRSDGKETVAQKWVAVVSAGHQTAFTCINEGVYGLDFTAGELRLSLLRSPAYSGHYLVNQPLVAQYRYTPRMDLGQRRFRFWLNGGPADQRLAAVDREATVHNEKPFALYLSPSGDGQKPKAGPGLSDAVVQLAAFKQAENGRDLIVRLFNPTSRPRATTLSLPFASAKTKTKVTLGGFELKTLRYQTKVKRFVEVNLLEE